jgi:hypothetical protein
MFKKKKKIETPKQPEAIAAPEAIQQQQLTPELAAFAFARYGDRFVGLAEILEDYLRTRNDPRQHAQRDYQQLCKLMAWAYSWRFVQTPVPPA